MKRQLKNKGFTLIEIVMVLVLFGILAAVALPKFFDLRQVAVERAADAVVQEIQAQVNGRFAQEILNGTSCTDALGLAVNDIPNTKTSGDIKELNTGTDVSLDTEQIKVTFTLQGVSMKKDGTPLGGLIILPGCKK